ASPMVAPTPSLAEPLSTEVDEVDEVEKRGFGFNGVLGIMMVELGAFVATYIFKVVVKRSRSYEGKHRSEEEVISYCWCGDTGCAGAHVRGGRYRLGRGGWSLSGRWLGPAPA